MKNFHKKLPWALAGSIIWVGGAHATSFDIPSGGTVTSAQTLNGGETGVIRTGGTLNPSTTAIAVSGSGNTITNAGTLRTTADFAHGFNLDNSASNAVVNNSGSISVGGFSASAINSYLGADINISNSGSISTAGQSGRGIAAFGSGATLSNSGTIRTTGLYGMGVLIWGANSTLSNSGSITTTSNLTHAVYLSTGTSVVINNSGVLDTTGNDSSGIYSAGTGTTVRSSGGIRTSGANAHGIHATEASATIANSGTIVTTGSAAAGIYAGNHSAVINNSGTISVSGPSSVGIYATNTATISNSGVIRATGSGAFAISGNDSSAQTVNLYPGSRIYGLVDLGGSSDADVVNVYGYGGTGSSVLTLRNVETVNVYASNISKLGNGKLVVVESTGEAARGASQSMLALGIHNVIDQRGAGLMGFKTSQVAADDLNADMLPKERRPVLWVQTFGANGQRPADGSAQAYNHDQVGLVAGYEHELISGTRLGWVLGVASGQVSSSSQRNASDTIYGGGYAEQLVWNRRIKLGASWVGGIGYHRNRRDVQDNLSGLQTANGNSNSTFFSPAWNVSSAFSVATNWEIRPAAQMAYSYGYYEGYSESGSSNANLLFGGHDVQSLLARTQLEGARKLDTGEINARAGWQQRSSRGSAVGVRMDGYALSASPAGSQDVSGPYAGIGVQYQLKQQWRVLGDIEYATFSGGETLTSGRVSLQYLF